jgi:hypothetical protein
MAGLNWTKVEIERRISVYGTERLEQAPASEEARAAFRHAMAEGACREPPVEKRRRRRRAHSKPVAVANSSPPRPDAKATAVIDELALALVQEIKNRSSSVLAAPIEHEPLAGQ